MFLLRKQPLVFLKITVSVLSLRDRCNFTKKWTTSPVSFKNFVYFLRAPFNGCFSYQYNISYRHIRVFVKNLIRFPDYKKSHFHSVFICFIARITWSTAAKITESWCCLSNIDFAFIKPEKAIIKHAKRCRGCEVSGILDSRFSSSLSPQQTITRSNSTIEALEQGV